MEYNVHNTDNAPKSETPEAQRGLKSEFLWNSVGNIIYLGSQWLLTYVVILVLGYDLGGVFSLAMSVGTLVSTVGVYNMRNYQASDLENRFTGREYILSRYFTSFVAFAGCLIYLGFTDYPEFTVACIAVYGLFKVSEAMSDVYQGIYQRYRRLDYVGKTYLIKSVTETVAFCVILILTRDLLFSIIALTVVSWLEILAVERTIANRIISRKEPDSQNISLREAIIKVKKLLFICLPVAVCLFLMNSTGQIPRLFLEQQLGSEILGIYTSIAMPVMLLQVAASYIFTPLIVPFSQYYTNRNMGKFLGLLKKTAVVIAALAIAFFAIFNLFGQWIMGLLFGQSILPYLYLVNPLILSGLLVALFWFLSALLTIIRKLKFLLIISSVSFVVTLAGSSAFITWFGLNGATFIYVTALIIFNVGCALTLTVDLKKRMK